MYIRKIVFLIYMSTLSFVYAAGSQFGLINQTYGNVLMPYSAAGLARSYEIAHADSLQLNLKNFATSTNISKTTFSLHGSYDAVFGENRVETSFIEKANFQGVHIAIPIIQRQIAFGAGLQPFTSIEHRILNSVSEGYDIEENRNISGGLSKANFNLAYKFNEQLSLALGYEYTFGKINRDVISVVDTPVPSEIALKFQDQFSGHGIIFSVFSNPMPDLYVGLMLKPTIKGQIIKTANTPSTALNAETKLDASLPTEINLGLEYSLTNIYNVGFDVIYQDWKDGFEINNKNIKNYNTFYHLGVGFERKGSHRRFVKYWEQIDFRAGFFYSQLAYLNNGKNVNEIGLSGGFSLPIQRFSSKIDLGGFISQRGELSKNNLKETVVGLRITISATETWFVNLED